MAFKTSLLLLAILGLGRLPALPPTTFSASPDLQREARDGPPVLWREPADLTGEDLFGGPGGEEHRPHGILTFVSEDLGGSTPKFVVRDETGITWTAKLGSQAQPEIAATRLVWALGYSVDEDYFLPEAHVRGMPSHVHRGQGLIGANGLMRNIRLERKQDHRKKIGNWRWRDGPFAGTRELNGLRVLMAVINNWDLKDSNNSVFEQRGAAGTDERIYEITDLGASFGSAGLERTDRSIGNLQSFQRSRFITNLTADDVDFSVPSRPAFIVIVNAPEYIRRLRLLWIGQHIPRVDARWMGQMLTRLSEDQIRDAFRAAGYPPEEVEGFTAVLESRAAQLNGL